MRIYVSFKSLSLTFTVIGFGAVHLMKMMRMYLVLLEQRVSFKKFVLAYFRTTIANLLIPFKIGELYRIYVLGKITGNKQVGLFSVIVDRFFDTLALVIILIPFELLVRRNLSFPAVALLGFVLIILFGYRMFPSAYEYLNHYIIVNKKSKRSMAALKSLEVLRALYQYVLDLVTGRHSLLTLLSFGVWMTECLVLYLFADAFGIPCSLETLAGYISSIFSTSPSRLTQSYTIFSIVVLLIGMLVSACVLNSKKHEEGKKGEKSSL